jgi:hypothetical protein
VTEQKTEAISICCSIFYSIIKSLGRELEGILKILEDLEKAPQIIPHLYGIQIYTN